MFKLAQNSASINIVEMRIILIGEIREPTIVDEELLNFMAAFWFMNSDWQGRLLSQSGRGLRG
jgi:hypothetical protein